MSRAGDGCVDEDYAGALLHFQEWCVEQGVPFKEAMRAAMAAHMGIRAEAGLTIREKMAGKKGRAVGDGGKRLG